MRRYAYEAGFESCEYHLYTGPVIDFPDAGKKQYGFPGSIRGSSDSGRDTISGKIRKKSKEKRC